MHIRRALLTDVDQITSVFADTVTRVNSKDYNAEQIRIWSSGAANVERWQQGIERQYFLVAEIEHDIVGFSSMAKDGYIDLLYVHHAYQGRHVGSALMAGMELNALEKGLNELTADVSITARSFFERQGFVLVQEQSKEIQGAIFKNHKMHKALK